MRTTWKTGIMVAIMVSILGLITSAEASWDANGNPICATSRNQDYQKSICDGSGGWIVLWEGEINDDGDRELFAQKIDSAGNIQWGEDGIQIRSGVDPSSNLFYAQIAQDGEGGAVIVWRDLRGFYPHIYCQRIDGNGNIQWASGGVAISSGLAENENPVIVSDGAGGAFIAWSMQPTGYQEPFLQVQRVDADGQVQWATNGITLDQYVNGYDAYPDRDGGVFIANATADNGTWDIRIWRIKPNGSYAWSPSFRDICTAGGAQYDPRVTTDGSGGVILSWVDERGSAPALYAQRVTANGAVLWTSNGVSVVASLGWYSPWAVTAGGSAGAIFTWSNSGIFAQRVDDDGQIQWGSGGVSICNNGSITNYITMDGMGGAIIAWDDWRSGTNYDVYAQRINESGVVQWATNGAPICTESHDQGSAKVHVGGLITWIDARDDSGDIYGMRVESGPVQLVPACDITVKYYKKTANRIMPADSTFMYSCPQGDQDSIKVYLDFVDADMVRDYAANEITMEVQGDLERFMFWSGLLHASDSITSANGYQTTITYACSSAEPCTQSCQDPTPDALKVRLIGYDVGWAEGIIVKSPDYTGAGGVSDGTVGLSDLVPFGATNGKNKGQEGFNTYFDFNGDDMVNLSDFACIGTHYGHSKPAFSPAPVSAPPAASNAVAVLAVGESEENGISRRLHVTLSLDAAGKFAAMSLGLDNEFPGLKFLGWAQNPDLKGTSAAMPVQQNGKDVLFIAAFDMHEAGNGGAIELGTLEFVATKEAAAAIAEKGFPVLYAEIAESETVVKSLRVETGKNESPTPMAIDVLGPCFPNPFNPTTTIDYAISKDSQVNLSVYSIDGRLVRTLVNEFQKGSRHSVLWDGKDDRGNPVASGVYLCRIRTERMNETMKLVLVR